MCMALPGGRGRYAPESRSRQFVQWLSFAALLGRMLTIGLLQWITRRWILRDPNVG